MRPDLNESSSARERSHAFRQRYAAHPYLWGGLPLALGLALAVLALFTHSGFHFTLAAAIIAFGLLIEVLNLGDSVWRWKRRRARR